MPRVIILLIILALSGCSSPPSSVNEFDDSILIKIAGWQDRRLSDSLYLYFSSEEVKYRRAAVQAFASIQDTNAVEKLSHVLSQDDDETTRQYAAFALGQTRSNSSSENLKQAHNSEQNPQVKREIFEALGKGTNLFTDEWNTSSKEEHMVWGYYRSALNNIPDSTTIQHMASFLSPHHSYNVRLGAANFFAQGKINNIQYVEEFLVASAKEDPDADVRMAAVAGLGKSISDSVSTIIGDIVVNDVDYRVRVNAIRALSAMEYDSVKIYLYHALADSNINVVVASAETIRSVVSRSGWKEALGHARKTNRWRVQALLYEGTLKVTHDKEIAEEVMRLYRNSDNVYHKAALLTALGKAIISSSFVAAEMDSTSAPMIRSSAASALAAMNRGEEFSESQRNIFLTWYRKGFDLDDLAVTGILAEVLRDTTLAWKAHIDNIDFLHEAKSRLSLPKDYEAYEPIERTIAYFEGREAASPPKDFNRPIDWELVRSIPKDQRALIETTRGKILVRLFVEEAPGSVANFVALAKAGYFENKTIHRVVPNFVIQGGCNRGDGWGSEDYSIRSEFTARKYTTGSMGMASAGKDTEGTQWFITHSPTPHLDGRYTIFAEVVEGMEVVHQIEMGDRIVNIALP